MIMMGLSAVMLFALPKMMANISMSSLSLWTVTRTSLIMTYELRP
jgi:hypothetical protein